MLNRAFLTLVIVATFAAPARPCSVVDPMLSAQDLVKQAEVIVRVRADRLAEAPGRQDVVGGSATQVRFVVLDVLKGRLAATTIEFNGTLSDRDDRNDGPVPYAWVRPGGRSGNCVALAYKPNAEYLMLLRRDASYAQPNDLTPYWALLGPTNEQLFGGATDPWLVWVAQQIREQ